ncbi:CYTH domain-containing protein [Gemelliphila palaticanis]|uniref:CYTH domain-containing protein n=1 Tax=Gemelliphila palaticanis TaxID=81950 RepID=A0ABX2T182_9BACL|nr:CYTH domain-containing protein [Gemella palaticanis]MBF0714836.1 CYTH domain-containing protein [Gemella palaticanis]NYS46766.1 CYTH domain-containing protein [Gemella palaticanis]
MENIEIEFKNLLTEQEYTRIYDYYKLSNCPDILNVNHYYDTKNYELKNNNCAFRIRISNLLREMTLKIKRDKGNLEINVPVSSEKIPEIISLENLPLEIQEKLKLFKIKDELKLINKIETIRKELKLEKGLLVLDKTTYINNIEDYELEFEVFDYLEGKKEFLSILNNLSLERKKAIPKIARAEHYKKNIQ